MTKRSKPFLLAAMWGIMDLAGSQMICSGETPPFLAGVDMSHLAFFEDRGKVYMDNGRSEDALTILADRGINCVRLRLFTSSAAQAQSDAYNFTNNLDYVLPLAVRVKSKGLKLLLDFHYSDSWADPGKQNKPATWTNLNFTQLKAQVRSYTSNSIAVLNQAGAMPDYVQTGNEITPGFLWNDGKVSASYDTAAQWSQFGQLLTNAIQGVEDAAGAQKPKVIIHIDRGGDWGATQWFFDKLLEQRVPFDLIGQSYYPWWHGPWTNLQNCLSNAVVRYGRPVLILETAFPWANSTNLYGIGASTNGQVQYVSELARIIKGLPGGKGAGIFWWGTEYQPLTGYQLAGFDRRSFFNAAGEVLPVAETFGAMAAPVVIVASVSNTLLQLRWPLSGAGMALQTCTNLTMPVWTETTTPVQSAGSALWTSMLLDQPERRFFRLRSSN